MATPKASKKVAQAMAAKPSKADKSKTQQVSTKPLVTKEHQINHSALSGPVKHLKGFTSKDIAAIAEMVDCEASCEDYNVFFAAAGDTSNAVPMPRVQAGTAPVPYLPVRGGGVGSFVVGPGELVFLAPTPEHRYPYALLHYSATDVAANAQLFQSTFTVNVQGVSQTYNTGDVETYFCDNLSTESSFMQAGCTASWGRFAAGDPRGLVAAVPQDDWWAGAQSGYVDIRRDVPTGYQYMGGRFCGRVLTPWNGSGMLHWLAPEDNPQFYGCLREPVANFPSVPGNRPGAAYLANPSYYSPDVKLLTGTLQQFRQSTRMCATMGATEAASQAFCCTPRPTQTNFVRHATIVGSSVSNDAFVNSAYGLYSRNNPTDVFTAGQGVLCIYNTSTSENMTVELSFDYAYNATLETQGITNPLTQALLAKAPRTIGHEVDLSGVSSALTVRGTVAEARRALIESASTGGIAKFANILAKSVNRGMDRQVLFPEISVPVGRKTAASRDSLAEPISVAKALHGLIPDDVISKVSDITSRIRSGAEKALSGGSAFVDKVAGFLGKAGPIAAKILSMF